MTEPKNIIITGASKGIGFAMAKAFLSDSNNTVVGIARSGEALTALSNETRGGKFIPISGDLSSSSFIHDLTKQITQLLSRIDVLVNNAGLLINKPYYDLKEEDLDAMYTLHLKVPFFLIQSLMPMMHPGAHIVNISSMGGFQGSVKFPTLSGYSATKGSLSILTEALAVELSEVGVSINCLALGSVQTEMLASAFPDFKATLSSDDFALFATKFCLEGHRYFNGKVLPVSLSTP